MSVLSRLSRYIAVTDKINVNNVNMIDLYIVKNQIQSNSTFIKILDTSSYDSHAIYKSHKSLTLDMVDDARSNTIALSVIICALLKSPNQCAQDEFDRLVIDGLHVGCVAVSQSLLGS